MTQENGAPLSGRAVVNGAGQAVSALRASVPSARGFAAIGLHMPKTSHNIGGALRAAQCYGASCVCISGERMNGKRIKSATNTLQTQRHIPLFRGDLRVLIPYAATPVAVDLVDDAELLPDFIHPHSAFYIFGPEDGTLGKSVLDWCPRRVMVPTAFCMNLAATVNVVLYDRLAKQRIRAAQAMSAGTAETAPQAQGQSPASAVRKDAPNEPLPDTSQDNTHG